jgi:autotransporter-associated beta strand protein
MSFDENAATSGRRNNCISNSADRRRRLALALAAVAGTVVPCSHAVAQALFTTEQDFAGWTATGASGTTGGAVAAVSSSVWDFDGSTTNGLGNTTPGAGTAGSLQVTLGSTALTGGGFNELAAGPGFNEFNNQAFLSAWDPGATANGANTAGDLVAFTGTMYMVYTTPTWSTAPGYYSLGFLFQYAGNGYYQTFFPSSTTSAGIVDGYQTTIATIPYTIDASSNAGLGFSLMINTQTGAVASSPIYIDDISMTLPTPPPPPPPDNATWQPGGTGNWSDSSADNNNWVGSTPPTGTASNATFDNGGAVSGPVNVDVLETQEVNNLTFNNPVGYKLNGSQVIVNGELTSTAGANTVNSLALDATGTVNVSISTGSSVTATTFTRTGFAPLMLSGGGALNVNTINGGNVELSGGSTLTIGNGTVPSGQAFLFDIGVTTTTDVVNLGQSNIYDNNSLSGNGTIIIGTGSTLTTDEFNGFSFNGSLSGNGALILGSSGGANSAGAPYTGEFTGTSPGFTGPISVEFLSTLQVGAGATLGTGNTITLDSGELQAAGNTTLSQNIVTEDTQGITNGTTTIDTQGYTLGLSGSITNGATIQNLAKVGTGTLILAGSASTYSGGTTVSAGTLYAGATNGLSPNSAISVSSGATLDVSGFANKIPSLTVSSGGTLNLGVGEVLTDTGSASFAGTLNIVGTPAGSTVELMSYTSDSGTFSTVTPEAGYNLVYGATELELISTGPATLTWNDASGNNLWDNGSSVNWNNGSSNVAFSAQSAVTFNDSNGSASGRYAVTLNTLVSPGSVTVNNSTGSYTISGMGTIGGTGSLSKLGTGTVTISTSNTYSGGTSVSAGKLIEAAASSIPHAGAVTISGSGTMKLADNISAGSAFNASDVVLSSLSITGNGTLDIGNNHIIIDYTTGHDPIASIQQWIKNGFNNGDVAGASPEIISTDIATDDSSSGLSYAIGYADGADGLIAGLPSGEIEIMYTLLGDANLDGTVNAEDYTPFSHNIGQTGMSWDDGDFNYDGTVNAEDYTPFSHNIGQFASLAASAGPLEPANNLSLANVPEPATFGLVVLAGVGALGRRSRRRSVR